MNPGASVGECPGASRRQEPTSALERILTACSACSAVEATASHFGWPTHLCKEIVGVAGVEAGAAAAAKAAAAAHAALEPLLSKLRRSQEAAGRAGIGMHVPAQQPAASSQLLPGTWIWKQARPASSRPTRAH